MTMNRSRSLAVLAVTVSYAVGTPVFAETVFEAAIGNTVSMTNEGVETRYYFNENGSVSQANSKGASDIGSWEAKDGNLCMAWASADAPACLPLSDQQAAIGDTVTVARADGTSTELTILAGKVPF
jgi:hypothetical protein